MGRMVNRMATPEAARPYLIAALWCHLGAPLLAIVPRPRTHAASMTISSPTWGRKAPYISSRSPKSCPSSVWLPMPPPTTRGYRPLQPFTSRHAPAHLRGMQLHREAPRSSSPPWWWRPTLGALTKTLPPETLDDTWHTLRVGERVRLADLLSRWVSLGYQRETGVEIPGSFSQRGGIVDIYPPSSPLPARIELWGDEIDSIRLSTPGHRGPCALWRV